MRELTSTAVMRRAGRFALGAVIASSAFVLSARIPTATADSPPKPTPVSDADANAEAAVLAAEDRRITEVRTVTSLARWQGKNWKTPYRLGTPAGYTLVLTPRSAPYTVKDLLKLAPQTFVRMSDGSYLLAEHIVVMARAKLVLSAPGGLRLRLASAASGFATIVSFGGEMQLLGEQGAPLTITSWDATSSAPDTLLTDGRAYIRAIGGQFEACYADLTDLGFWSGRTGGLALTGTDRPNTGAIDSGATADPDALLKDVTLQPAGPLQPGQSDPAFDYSVDGSDYVSSLLTNVTVDRSAYGLFVSGANGIQVSDSSFTNNLLGGVVLHRYVTNGVITGVTSSGNAADGFSVTRTASGIAITQSTADDNLGDGFSLDGRALAEEPSAVGAPLYDYGNNSVSNSTASGNTRYGVEVQGGFNIGVQNNTIAKSDMGVVVDGGAQGVAVTGNTISHAARHGIALVDGVQRASVTGNVIDGASTGVYVRDSNAEVKGNTIESADHHGVSLVGGVGGSQVSYNVLAGSGASALDMHRSHGDVATTANNADGWHDTTPWYFWFRKLLQPMTALWAVLAILIAVSAVRSRRKNGTIVHPYSHQMAHQGIAPVPLPDQVAVDAARIGR